MSIQTKPCIACGKECQLEEAISAYLEFASSDEYVSLFDVLNAADDVWWIHELIPMHNEYADVYPLHLDCLNEY